MLSWMCQFLQNMAQLSASISRLLRTITKWEAFQEIKKRISESLILACPDWTKEFVLQINACKKGQGSDFTEERDGRERIIA